MIPGRGFWIGWWVGVVKWLKGRWGIGDQVGLSMEMITAKSPSRQRRQQALHQPNQRHSTLRQLLNLHHHIETHNNQTNPADADRSPPSYAILMPDWNASVGVMRGGWR